jgi:hypothetical protein
MMDVVDPDVPAVTARLGRGADGVEEIPIMESLRIDNWSSCPNIAVRCQFSDKIDHSVVE